MKDFISAQIDLFKDFLFDLPSIIFCVAILTVVVKLVWYSF